MQKSTVDEVLDFAITGERAANRFYLELAANMDNDAMKKVFEEFAAEEKKHEAILLGIKEGKAIESKEVADLKIADYVVNVEPRPDMEYQDALILAMKREKAACEMYNRMAAVTHNEQTRQTFLTLAREEAKHKLHFEAEYDQVILEEN